MIPAHGREASWGHALYLVKRNYHGLLIYLTFVILVIELQH